MITALRAFRACQPYGQMEDWWRMGLVSDREWRRYKLAWWWSAGRFTCGPQDRLWNRLGGDAVRARIARCNAAVSRALASARGQEGGGR